MVQALCPKQTGCGLGVRVKSVFGCLFGMGNPKLAGVTSPWPLSGLLPILHHCLQPTGAALLPLPMLSRNWNGDCSSVLSVASRLYLPKERYRRTEPGQESNFTCPPLNSARPVAAISRAGALYCVAVDSSASNAAFFSRQFLPVKLSAMALHSLRIDSGETLTGCALSSVMDGRAATA